VDPFVWFDPMDLAARHLNPDETEHTEDAHHQKQETGEQDLYVVKVSVRQKGQNQGEQVQEQGLIEKRCG